MSLENRVGFDVPSCRPKRDRTICACDGENTDATCLETLFAITFHNAFCQRFGQSNVDFIGDVAMCFGLADGLRNPGELKLDGYDPLVQGHPAVEFLECSSGSPNYEPRGDQRCDVQIDLLRSYVVLHLLLETSDCYVSPRSRVRYPIQEVDPPRGADGVPLSEVEPLLHAVLIEAEPDQIANAPGKSEFRSGG
jgi:hypothetical protein